MAEKNLNKKLESLKCAEPALELVWQAKRLETLNNWIMARPSAREMAEAGFHCPIAAHPGIVKCFSCFIELGDWEPTDKPWEEHRKRALTLDPPCKFVEIGKKESELLVGDYLEILKSMMLRLAKLNCEQNLKIVLDAHKEKKKLLKKDLKKLGMS